MLHYKTCSLYHYTTCSLLEANRNLFTINFSPAGIINIRYISNHKMTSVRLEPQWHITQPVVFTMHYRPLVRCWKHGDAATYSP